MRIFLALVLFASTANAAYQSDGNQLYWDLSSVASLSFSNEISISVWTKILSTGTGLTQRNGFVSKGVINAFNYNLMISGSQLRFNYVSGPSTQHNWDTTSGIIWTNQIHHLAMSLVWGTGSSMKVYVDGVATGGAWVNGNGNTNATINGNPFSVGVDQPNTGGGYILMGVIDNVAVWNKALTDGELKLLYSSRMKLVELQIQPTNLIVLYVFNNGPFPIAASVGGERDYSQYHNRLLPHGAGDSRMEPTFLSFQPNQ